MELDEENNVYSSEEEEDHSEMEVADAVATAKQEFQS